MSSPKKCCNPFGHAVDKSVDKDGVCPVCNPSSKELDLGEGLFAGKKLKDMSREELYAAFANLDRFYRDVLKQNL